jgi:DNA-damage-inducible protein J
MMTENSLPSDLEIPNAATVEAIEEARQGGLAQVDSVSDLIADLNSED